jgi:hypothetical protein
VCVRQLSTVTSKVGGVCVTSGDPPGAVKILRSVLAAAHPGHLRHPAKGRPVSFSLSGLLKTNTWVFWTQGLLLQTGTKPFQMLSPNPVFPASVLWPFMPIMNIFQGPLIGPPQPANLDCLPLLHLVTVSLLFQTEGP